MKLAKRHTAFKKGLNADELSKLNREVLTCLNLEKQFITLDDALAGIQYASINPSHFVEDILCSIFKKENPSSVIVLSSHRGTFVNLKGQTYRTDESLEDTISFLENLLTNAQTSEEIFS